MINHTLRIYRWSQKTYAILDNLNIRTTEDLQYVSLTALEELGLPKKVIKTLKNICHVYKINTKETVWKIYEFNFTYNYSYNPAEELGNYRCIATDMETALRSFEEFKAKNPNKNILSEPTIDETLVFNGMEIEEF